MASWQAHLTVWLLKALFKPRLSRAQNASDVRRLFRTRAYRLPSRINSRQHRWEGVPGERVKGQGESGAPMLFLHGGGYIACSPESHRPITAAFAARGFDVWVPDYRLAPEHPFPAALDDAETVYRSMPRHPVLAGDSAGGGLALALLLRLRDSGQPLPGRVVLFSPWTDLAGTGESLITNDSRCALFRGRQITAMAHSYYGAAGPRHPLVSPLYGDLHGLPPMLIHASQDEVLRDDSVRLAERARAAGVDVQLRLWTGLPHDWQLMPHLPEAAESLDEAAYFLKQPVEAVR